MLSLTSILEALFLVIALSIDAFVASFAYGSDRIHIPYVSVFIISGICSLVLGISLFVGVLVKPWVPASLIAWICFLLLFTLGAFKVFDSSVKRLIRKYQKVHRQVSFSIFQLHFLLQVYADPQSADYDHSRILNPSEAALLAISLSIDGLAAGFSAGLTNLNPWLVLLLSFICGAVMVISGSKLGKMMADNSRFDLSWMSGCILIILAFLKLM